MRCRPRRRARRRRRVLFREERARARSCDFSVSAASRRARTRRRGGCVQGGAVRRLRSSATPAALDETREVQDLRRAPRRRRGEDALVEGLRRQTRLGHRVELGSRKRMYSPRSVRASPATPPGRPFTSRVERTRGDARTPSCNCCRWTRASPDASRSCRARNRTDERRARTEDARRCTGRRAEIQRPARTRRPRTRTTRADVGSSARRPPRACVVASERATRQKNVTFQTPARSARIDRRAEES